MPRQNLYQSHFAHPTRIGSLTTIRYDSAPSIETTAQITSARRNECVLSKSHPVTIGANEAHTKLPKF
jgi:hypothetical protein